MSTIDTNIDEDLSIDADQLFRTRIADKGQYYVKLAGTKLLPDPNQDPNGKDQSKYNTYKQRAEFDDYTNKTKVSLLGKLDADKLDADLPAELDYLIGNADGDGLSLAGYAENVYSENLLAKYCIGVVHHGGLMSADISELSAEEVEQQSLNPQLKLYTRDSIVKRNFDVINGRKQLTMIMFYECGYEMDRETFQKTKVESYLVLALDENGNYYQQKIVKDSGTQNGQGERNYITINGEPVKMIPLYIFSDSETQSELPCGFGFLTPIAEICYHLYAVSADHNQERGISMTTLNAYGFDEQANETFKTVNGYYKIGGVNFMPPDTEMVNTSSQFDNSSYLEYEQSRTEKARSIGAVIPKKQGENKTATEAVINAGEQNDTLLPMVDNVERGLKWLIAYCGLFLGIYQSEQLEQSADEINITLNREFVKLEPDSQLLQAMFDAVDRQMMRKESVIKYLVSVGLEDGEIQEIVNELESQPPALMPSRQPVDDMGA